MELKDFFTVKIQRINEGPNDSEFFTVRGYAIIVAADGSLTVQGEKQGCGLGAGLWRGFTVEKDMKN
jgi:hypothetical protein